MTDLETRLDTIQKIEVGGIANWREYMSPETERPDVRVKQQ